MKEEDKMGEKTKKSAFLHIKASHTEFVTDKNREDELKELMKKLKKSE